ncbi:MAG TPA: hypothetical protein VII13_18755 [Vicinamibacteria bacterium]|jgi:hypothetical protein
MAVLAVIALLAAGTPDVAVSASFVPPAGKGKPAVVAVHFAPRNPDIHVNEDPAPRLKLDAAQTVLVERPASAARPPGKPGQARYLDTTFPLTFPVSWSGEPAPAVKGAVTYFYCSKRDGWCRKGTADVSIPVARH